MFKIGDRVECIWEIHVGGHYKLSGEKGTVIEITKKGDLYTFGVEFDNNICGHDCRGLGKPGHCYWIDEGFIKYINKEMSPGILPSENKTIFTTGAKRSISDTQKGRYDLLPWDAIHELAIHCAEGAAIHGERNCEKGIPIHSLIDSAIRHLSMYLQGKTDEKHLRAAMWNISFAIWMEKNKPEMQDVPSRMED